LHPNFLVIVDSPYFETGRELNLCVLLFLARLDGVIASEATQSIVQP
jgi:hypothetical protein